MAKTITRPKDNFGILFTCIGRRVSLLKSFRIAAKKLHIKVSFYGTDIDTLSPAFRLCDNGFLVKPTTHGNYISQLLDIVKANKIRLIVPTVDLDLKDLALNKAKFERLGCKVLVSQPDVVDICQNKLKTYHFLRDNNFDTPWTLTAQQALAESKINYPLFLKPRDGSASKGNVAITSRKELAVFAKRIPNCIVQEFITGTEHTCDAYVDFNNKVRCVVPRRRIEVRSGEVSKGQTVKDADIMHEVARLVEKLGAGPGVITIQLFLNGNKKIKFIEINPRFGGGAPLSIKAGADFPKWVLQELFGQQPKIKFDGFEDGLIMLRYDSEVWIHADEI